MCQVLNVHGVNYIRQTEIFTAKYLSLVTWRLRLVLKSLKDINKIDQIPAEMIQAGNRRLHSELHELIYSMCNKDKLHQQLKELTFR